MKAVKVSVRNFLGIRMGEFSFSPSVNVVSGANGSGKSSLLKAIAKAVEGGRVDASVIYKDKSGATVKEAIEPEGVEKTVERIEAGEWKDFGYAEIVLTLDDSTRIRRAISDTGSVVQVMQNKGGLDVALRSPQAFLNSIIGRVGMDPISFFRASPAEKRKILLEAVPSLLTLDDLSNEIEKYVPKVAGAVVVMNDLVQNLLTTLPATFGLDALETVEKIVGDIRHEQNSSARHNEEAAISEAAKLPPGYVIEEVPEVDSVLAELAAATETVAAYERAAAHRVAAFNAWAAAEKMVDMRSKEVDDLKSRLAAKVSELEEMKATFATLHQAEADANAACSEAQKCIVEAEPIRERLLSLETRRSFVRSYESAAQKRKQAEYHKTMVKAMDSIARQGIRTSLPALLWQRMSDSPLGALKIGMEGGTITVDGVSIENLSQSEQIRLAVAVARASVPPEGLKVILVDGYEALDETTRAAFAEEAMKDDFQYIVAEVGDGPVSVTPVESAPIG